MEQFEKLGITGPMLKAIEEEKFEKPSEIQLKSVPLVLKGRDVIAKSSTGSGKTLVFGTSIIHDCVKGKGIQALVLTPTRELAEQVCRALRKFSKYKPLDMTAVYGGVAIDPQIQNLRKADVVVGTPGRLLDHIERRTIDLRKVKILVLDEADRMLDMGFIDDVEQIMRQCPKKKQTMFFSATIPEDIVDLSHKYMHNPVNVAAESYVDPKKLKQIYFDVDGRSKFSLLVHLLRQEKSRLILIFCNTKITTDFISNNLKALGVNAQAIHGGLSQNVRSRALDHFHAQRVTVLVCTDVAARGLDIKGVTHVYNYDIPKESKQYIHRIGRTARAGKEGEAINLLSEKDYDNFSRIQRDYSIEVEKVQTPKFERVKIKVPGRFSGSREGYGRGHGGHGGHGGHSSHGGHGGHGGHGSGRGPSKFGRHKGHKGHSIHGGHGRSGSTKSRFSRARRSSGHKPWRN